MEKSLQFELWHECNSLCDFCYLGKDNRLTPTELKIKALKDVYEVINSADYSKYNNVSFIGGEFFQGQLSTPEVKELFMKVMEKTVNLLKNKTINSIWLTTTLTLGDQKDLYDVLDLIKDFEPDKEDGSAGFWVCTSWDIKGRFHNKQMEDNFDYHLKNIHEKYPFIKFNTVIILMQTFIEAYLNNEFSFKKFSKKYNTTFFFKQPGAREVTFDVENSGMTESDVLLKSKQDFEEKSTFPFFVKRTTFIKFLKKMLNEDRELYDRLFNIKYRADDFIRNFNDNERRMIETQRIKTGDIEIASGVDSKLNYCGHMLNYASYIEDNHCMICDRNAIFEEYS